ncbi:DUF4870 domain-containing protein [Streptobacillus felis]|uniref:DUF4870 domain-containing protein n=1 Tax=Streptobacillus felis TaxID=1384509 RepID=A0A7Z0PHF1_9FUSO|nr:DUF4870 domain-containing protein [Streptobacillus felis]NYV28060.1 DUF4870 domain-containing protein [Streptobacillus felis]
MKKSIGNLNENLVATIILIASSISLIGFIFSIGALILEKENDFVRDYAKQGIIFSLFTYTANLFKFDHSFLFISISGLLSLVVFILIVVTAIHAYKGEEFKFDFMRKIFEYIKL